MKVLVQGAMLKCSHNGTFPIASGSPLLKIGGKPVAVAGMEIGAAFATCTHQVSGSPSPCSVVAPATAGVSTKLKVGGLGVLLDSAAGITVNAPPGTWSVDDAGQTLLEER